MFYVGQEVMFSSIDQGGIFWYKGRIVELVEDSAVIQLDCQMLVTKQLKYLMKV